MNNTGMCALARLPPVISQVLFSNGRTYLFIYESKYLLSICYVPAMVTHAGVEGGYDGAHKSHVLLLLERGRHES